MVKMLDNEPDSPRTVRFSDLPDQSTGRVLGDLEHCVRLLKERGWESIAVDITTPDIADIGFRVVRVMVPGLVPLHGNENFPYFGVRRLHDITETLSRLDPNWDPDQGLSPFPHPFA